MTLVLLILIAMYFILAFSMMVPGNPHKNIILENTLPKDKLTDPRVTAIRKMYKKRLLQFAGILTLVTLPSFLLRYDSLVMLSFTLLLLISIFSFFLLEIRYIRKMRELIVKEDWELPTEAILVDTKLVRLKNQKMVSPYWFIPVIILLGISIWLSTQDWNGGSLIMILASIFLVAMMLVLYWTIRRLPVKPLTDDAQINQQYNDLMRHHWSALVLILTYAFLPMFFMPSSIYQLSTFWANVSLALFLMILFAAVFFTFYYLYDLRRKQDFLIEQAPDYRYTGDDQYWKYGVYINPNDQRLMVPDRIGMNISVNLGKKSGQVFMIVTGIVVAFALLAANIPLFMMDFTNDPVQAELSQKELVLKAPMTTTSEIPLGTIESVELVNELPSNVIRTAGIGSDQYLLGNFTVAGKNSVLYIDTDSKPILKITTKAKDYYFTEKKPTDTQKLYDKLTAEP
ncbi:PH domain-containing protein [Enterococcus canis]|uniref:PH domain-containing protein n=1 Tax=Enterococcus canis TaxID=214095 RepID=UPI0008352DCA|nr:PH domain-containing protein [Enterococcus canis]